MVESCVDAKTYLEFGENDTCELWGAGKVSRIASVFQTLHIPHGIIIIHKGFQALTGVCIPNTTAKIDQRIAFCYMMHRKTYMRPSIAQETISVPS